MSHLRLITANSQYDLVHLLGNSIRNEPLPGFVQEEVIVLSNGMARWLSMELASELGVAAGLHFSFPNALLDRCFTDVLVDCPSSLPFSRQALEWRIATELSALVKRTDFAPVAAYLGTARDDRRLLQLAHAIADCFDQYTIFRPEMIHDWDAGHDSQWQAELWRAISRGCQGAHRAGLLARLKQHAELGLPPVRPLPPRISLFGISYLPPFHIEALRHLSRYTSITCYLLNPCGEYWGTIISPARKSRLQLTPTAGQEACDYYETGNPLLSSLGTLGQEFFETLLDYGFEEMSNAAPVAASQPDNVQILSTIQQDILTLQDRTQPGNQFVVDAEDRSLRIHSCHSQQREMEVLYDSLLSFFEELPDLEPRQIVVMIPDIESYVPYISAVFGNPSGARPPLPYSIADRSMRRESQVVNAFLKLLAIGNSRFELSTIMELLECSPISRKLTLAEEEFTAIKQWLVDCRVHWGADAQHRRQLGFPDYADFSWQAGLDRLLLGYAMHSSQTESFLGITPHPASSGNRALPLGKLADFLTRLRLFQDQLSHSYNLSEWSELLSTCLNDFLEADENDSSGLLTINQTLNSMREICHTGQFTYSLDAASVRDHLTDALSGSGSGYGFLGGAITFCAMLPMRSIPMRIIWLAGMNDGAYPRSGRLPGYSLMNGLRRRGDRSLRDEDRYLFLEALMAAGERLHISYIGQSNRDNSSIPPSVLVAELLDYVRKGFISADTFEPPDLTTRHRLQNFSVAYFNNSDPWLFSYDAATCRALSRINQGEYQLSEFCPAALPTTDEQHISHQQLIRFLSLPALEFLRSRLHVYPHDLDTEPDDSEPMVLDALSRYSLSQQLVIWIQQGADYNECFARARSLGSVPPLAAGELTFASLWESSRNFASQLSTYSNQPLSPLTMTVHCAPLTLEVELTTCHKTALVRWRNASLKAKDLLALWVEHLLLNHIYAPDYPRSSVMVARNEVITLSPLDNATPILEDLLKLYQLGMTRPLPFFPETGWAMINGSAAKADSAWHGTPWQNIPGEKDHSAIHTCFGDSDPRTDEFMSLADRIYRPLLDLLAVSTSS